ncbi:MAG: HEPN domain-containing protein [Clostridiales bacterium]|nr:HEPN domain-containing protein [Clostridiales bacterium]
MSKLQSQFLSLANADLGIAEFALKNSADEAFLHQAAYHCQQAAEKLIKSVYVENKVELRKVHNISDLIAGIKDAAERSWFAELISNEPHISRWADLRYITNYKASKDDVTHILGILRQIHQEESRLQAATADNLELFTEYRKDN